MNTKVYLSAIIFFQAMTLSEVAHTVMYTYICLAMAIIMAIKTIVEIIKAQ